MLGSENVIFTGFLSDPQYRGLIATCDFVANISSEPYGIPHTITKGSAAGRPVIISGNPSVRKLLSDDYP
jgi:glycosyltransferase involved in cell wall biosynthesis